MDSDSDSDKSDLGDTQDSSNDSFSDEFGGDSDTSESDSGSDNDVRSNIIARTPWIPVLDLQADTVPVHNFQYTEDSGVSQVNFTNDMKVVDYFLKLMGEDTIRDIVYETNRYAAVKIMKNTPLRRRSRLGDWIDTTVDEMKAFFGIVTNMGLVKKTRIEAYWNKSNPSQATPYFATVFSRDRFLLLLSMFNIPMDQSDATEGFANSGKRAHYLISKLNANCQQLYTMAQEVSVDESLVGYLGRYSGIQYMPNKHHHKFGIKLWMLCEASTGYAYHMNMYRGRKRGEPPEENATYNIVMRLMNPILDLGYHVFLDNYFSSPKLFRDLYNHSTLATGTCRKNRKGIPPSVTKKLNKGDAVASRSQSLLAVGFEDKKHIILLSTSASAQMKDITSRRGRQRRVPHPVDIYNQNMGGVDLSDMRLYCFLDERKTWKWTKKLFFNLISRMSFNAYILYQSHRSKAGLKVIERHAFQIELVKGLVGQVCAPINKTGRRSLTPAAAGSRLANPRSHMKQTKLPTGKRRNCVVCTKLQAGKRVRTSFVCETCGVALCLGACWESYHTNQNI